MYHEPPDTVPLWGLLAHSLVGLLAVQGGHLFGRWRQARRADEKDAPVGAMVRSIRGLLARRSPHGEPRGDDGPATEHDVANSLTTRVAAREIRIPPWILKSWSA